MPAQVQLQMALCKRMCLYCNSIAFTSPVACRTAKIDRSCHVADHPVMGKACHLFKYLYGLYNSPLHDMNLHVIHCKAD